MEKAKTVIIESINLNNYIMTKALDSVSDEHFFIRPNENCSPIHFIIGHTTHYRHKICSLLGEDSTYQFADLYAMGKKIGDDSQYPSVTELKQEWQQVTEKLQTLLEKADTAVLAKEIPKKYPIGEQNVLGAIQFSLFHETEHLGQICFIRKFHGYDGAVG